MFRLLMGLFGAFSQGARDHSGWSGGDKLIRQFKERPELTDSVISKLTNRCWYINLEQISDWNSLIHQLPETFNIDGKLFCHYREVRSSGELLMFVQVCATELGTTMTGRSGVVDVYFYFPVHVKPNKQSGYYEMRTRVYSDTAEKNAMSMFGRKFFEMLKSMQEVKSA